MVSMYISTMFQQWIVWYKKSGSANMTIIIWYQMKPHLQNAHSQPYIAALSNSSTASSSSPTSTSSSQSTSLSQGIDESPKIGCSLFEFISSTSSLMFKSNKTKNNYIII
ncbi:hypothetical protein ACJIZ3_011386 [Penstemon smallii]|uniref:Uncharacterized protein n=1 Tax=Penstemon smallii TaxID=265156 RepID=A0ABD3UJ02_9LAMI